MQSMVTDQDIEKLRAVFATKADMAVFATRDDIGELRETIQMLSVSIDNLVKSVEDLKQEYSLVVH